MQNKLKFNYVHLNTRHFLYIEYIIRLYNDPCDPSVISQIFQPHSLEQNSVEKEQGRYALLYIMVRIHQT